jgi:2-polyprenyl-6-methoxyphenol hydroxylase-like FAD-dependent oxidoreductase
VADDRVIIVGAGPGGLTLGLMLSRAGIPVMVLEQSASFAREFRGDGLLPSGMRILRALGLGDRLQALEYTTPRIVRIRIGDRASVYESPPLRLADGTPAVTWIPQRRLLEMLAAAASASPRFRLLLGTAVRELIMEGDRCVGVRDAQTQRRAPLVVGFDGRFSAMRRSAGIELAAAKVDFDIAWCSVPRPPASGDAYEATVRGDEVCFWYPVGATMRIGVLLRKGQYTALRGAGFETFKRRVVDAVAEALRAPLEAALTGWDDVVLLPAVSEMARRWWRPGVLLLGDAAHPMSPVGAQGVNVALQDAVVAARHLVAALRSNREDLDETLHAIETERRPAVERVVRQQNALPRIMRALGSERALRLAAVIVPSLTRSGHQPAFVRRMIDRFLWGDPPVEVESGR